MLFPGSLYTAIPMGVQCSKQKENLTTEHSLVVRWEPDYVGICSLIVRREPDYVGIYSLVIRREPDYVGICSLVVRRESDYVGLCFLVVRREPDNVGICSLVVRRESDYVGICSLVVRREPDNVGICFLVVRREPDYVASCIMCSQCDSEVDPYCMEYPPYPRNCSVCVQFAPHDEICTAYREVEYCITEKRFINDTMIRITRDCSPVSMPGTCEYITQHATSIRVCFTTCKFDGCNTALTTYKLFTCSISMYCVCVLLLHYIGIL
ncbi:hypothetical protein ACF0H5_018698 [Mactra antiquata]